MKIITMGNSLDWFRLAAEGIQSIIRKNQYGRSFFTLYGNTFPIKDQLSKLGFKFFKGTWGLAVDSINDDIKNSLSGMGIDVSILDSELAKPSPEVPTDTLPPTSTGVPLNPDTEVKQEVTDKIDKPETKQDVPPEVAKELQRMKSGVDMAIKQHGSEKIKSLMGFVDRMIERVAQMTDEAAKKEIIKNFMQFTAKFHSYSFHNQMLIWVQNPFATYVKGFKQWMEMGREVTNWDKGIAIIAPMTKKVKVEGTPTDPGEAQEATRTFFGSVTVYDIADTKPIENWEKIKGKKPFEPVKWRSDSNESMEEVTVIVNAISDWAKSKGIKVDTEKMASDMGGFSAGGKIAINDTYQGINLFSTMAHEAAHEVLHWQETTEGGRKPENWTDTRQQKEIDAETTAYIVLQHYGFETKDTPNYLALWMAKGADIKNRRENISKAVKTIIAGIDEFMGKTNIEEVVPEKSTETIVANKIYKIVKIGEINKGYSN